VSEGPVLKPGGFWICPHCGQRNKVWAPCASCGTAISGMTEAPAPPPFAPPLTATVGGRGRRRGWLFYTFIVVGVLAAAGVAVALARVLGGAVILGDKASPSPVARAAPTPAPATPEALPETPLRRMVEPLPPPTPPAAVYSPSVPATPPAWSIPAPVRPGPPRSDVRAGADLRAHQQALRAAQARFDRAEAAAQAEGGDPERETSAMRELEAAARELREAEAALDRARRRMR
jgi:type IV secretory pathway VirB10-like protein